MRVNTRWSQFCDKEALADHLAMKRTEAMEEREAVRAAVRSKISRETVTKEAYEASRQPWELEEVEEEARRRVEAGLSSEERVAKLRQVTEKMLSHQSDYAQSARALAIAAYKVGKMKIILMFEDIIDINISFIRRLRRRQSTPARRRK